ncbi:hypothetical protein CY35_04G144400 [Sphagnum magellanicum]|nr:hypothetical protein CY35_04G144400 [Sphagnum magellanicum]
MARGLPSGKFRERVVKVFGGLMGVQNLAAWGVAGVVAYYLWIKPERDLKEEQEVRYNSTTIISKQRIDSMHSSQARAAALRMETDRLAYVERRRAMADSQDSRH